MTTLNPVLSPRELGRAIGVSESSVKRWIDRGSIPASRTSGGHRRVDIADAIQYIRHQGVALVAPEVFGLDELVGIELPREESSREQLAYDSLVAGNELEFRGQIVAAYLAGESVASICDGPVRSALDRIGEMYHDDPNGILIEHRATDICLQAVSQLRRMTGAQQTGRVAVGGALSGDVYMLPSLMVASVLNELGFETTNLGPDTPLETLEAACEIHRPELAWVSVSVVQDRRQLSRRIREFAEFFQSMGSVVVVGGRESHELELAGASNVQLAESLQDLSRWVESRSASESDSMASTSG